MNDVWKEITVKEMAQALKHPQLNHVWVLSDYKTLAWGWNGEAAILKSVDGKYYMRRASEQYFWGYV